ncbi:AAA family ATPase [Nitratiruptor sp. YY09-18]|uniref:AAA family ATPase n=1 Tax=Nitratiruptor sp. YY09-18 TaxID=2724901 RepID=UPI0019152386|nr:AAA family ATPase [Nitratiruptor sp. YY09-18]BCD67989.1 DNA repair protein RecN [Nitratiruptor sp. YY09-18]
MIERFFLKEHFNFDKVELEFERGLVVFTGPSGAGKSLLLSSILALFGYKNVEAKVSEALINIDIPLEEYGLEPDEDIVIRALKKEKVRYFINDQSISKKSIQKIFSSYVHYLSQKDTSFFASENILAMLDETIDAEEFHTLKSSYTRVYQEFGQKQRELQALRQKQNNIEEQKEFLRFEIEKISSIDPKPGEYEELLQIKKDLSKKEKIAQLLQQAEQIFEHEGSVDELLGLLEKDSGFFTAAMDELRDIIYSESARLQELEDIDIEQTLNRIEQLSGLIRKYGSIEEALLKLQEKKDELATIENIEYELLHLEKEIEQLQEKTLQLARELSSWRQCEAQKVLQKINAYAKSLKLPQVQLEFERGALGSSGFDRAVVRLAGVEFDKISSGEYNRLRLGFMAAMQSHKGYRGVLILDEIDANISGEESMAVARILKELAKEFQIFAISHQAQLASVADQHFLVRKAPEASVIPLEGEKRIKEIARIISGEKITNEAIEFAKKMLKESG